MSNSAAANLRLNKQLATANATWHLSSHTIVDSISDLSSACRHKRLLIEGRDVYCRGHDVYCNRCCNHRVGKSTWRQLLIIEVVTPSGIFLPGTELLQSPFGTEISMGSHSRRYRRSLRRRGAIADFCGVIAIPEAIDGCAGTDAATPIVALLAKHHKTL